LRKWRGKLTKKRDNRFSESCPAIVKVRWIDACVCNDTEFEMSKEWKSGCAMETCGFLVKETEDFLTIALDKYGEENNRYRHIMDIPTVGVVDLEILKEET